jgi:hypothetical protein
MKTAIFHKMLMQIESKDQLLDIFFKDYGYASIVSQLNWQTLSISAVTYLCKKFKQHCLCWPPTYYSNKKPELPDTLLEDTISSKFFLS